MMKKKQIFTPEGFAKLKSELNYLCTTKTQELAEKMQNLRADSNFMDSAELVEATKEREIIEARIRDLQKALAHAEISRPDKDNPRIEFGDRVTVRNQQGKKEVFTIVGSGEANPKDGNISYESPVGKGLLGKMVGDTVEIKVPIGVVKFKIIRIG